MNPAVLTRREFAVLGGEPAFAEPLHVGAPNVCDTQAAVPAARGGPRAASSRQPRALRARTGAPPRRAPAGAPLPGRVQRHRRPRPRGARRGSDGRGDRAGLDLRGDGARAHLAGDDARSSATWIPMTHNLDPALVEAAITPRTTGILAVHLWGRPAPVVDLAAIARRHGLRLLYDAAHAFGATRGGVPRGQLRRRRGLQLPRHQVLQHGRGRRHHHQRRRPRRAPAPGDELRLRRTRHRGRPGHQRQDERAVRRGRPHRPRGPRPGARRQRRQPPRLRAPARGAARASRC